MLKRVLLALLLAAPVAAQVPTDGSTCSMFGKPCSSTDTDCSVTSESLTPDLCRTAFASSGGSFDSSLLTSLSHYWFLNEASGTRSDSVGGYTLTDTNTVGSTTGVNSNAASFVGASSESLLYSGYQVSARTVNLWLWVDKAETNYSFLAYRAGSSQYGNVVTVTVNGYAGELIDCTWTDYGVGAPFARIPSASVPDKTWFMVTTWLAADNYAYVSINNGTPIQSSTQHTGNFQPLGGAVPYTGISSSVAGLASVDEVGVWSRVLTSDERTALYNSGAGRFYPGF